MARLITYNGQTRTIVGWSKAIGVNEVTLFARFAKGWSVERALTEPTNNVGQDGRPRQTPRLLTLHGKTLSISAWARHTGISRQAIHNRLNSGWTVERTLTSSLLKSGRPTKQPKPVSFTPFHELQRQHLAITQQLRDALRVCLRGIEQHLSSQLANYVKANGMPEAMRHRGVGSNFLEKPRHRTHSTAQETTELEKFK
jgi:hypothetical protein